MEGYIIFILLLLLSSQIKNKRYQLIMMFLVITVFSAIRYGIGFDYYTYLAESSGMKNNSSTEFIPRMIEDLSSQTFPFLFFVVTSVFISSFYFFGIRHAGHDYLLEVLFYVSFPFLFMNQLGVIRQGMATSLVFCAISLRDSKFYIRLALLIAAFFCHQSAIVGFLIFIPFERLNNKALWTFLILGFTSATIFIPIIQAIVGYGFLGDTGTQKALNYLGEEGLSEGKFIKYLVYFIGFIILVNYRRLVKYDQANAYYIGLIILGVSLYALFSYNISLGKRLGMFFFSSAIFVVPQLVKVLKMPRLIYLVLCIFLFGLTIYAGSGNVRDEDPPGCSVTYPYRTIFDASNWI